MTDIVSAYLDTWNATDAPTRKALLDQHWATDATYVDPLAEVGGHDGIFAAIDAVHDQFPGFVFTLVSGPDSHHRHARFQWGLGPRDAEPVIVGFDVLSTDEDGRIRAVVGFLDKVPG
ncbi:nuclear transport factor 2 family protein [Mycolicibacterium cosmeticum]|uniref:SnoaL-like domain protein n=1 Tax=Mycolicibacterium cosmeticum TaxID=258533 RepID=W9BHH8_MYCCO|nr:nuclear transport factor 2 family protein [Mycolicibacterium cosmeticum]TLH64988.1 nuclear transport factor 2 family protein [Mycolicibacterium cosmeticum]CDO06060.1 SnoaL-like domain protein [Mycolicibacterium cosmeticum]